MRILGKFMFPAYRPEILTAVHRLENKYPKGVLRWGVGTEEAPAPANLRPVLAFI